MGVREGIQGVASIASPTASVVTHIDSTLLGIMLHNPLFMNCII